MNLVVVLNLVFISIWGVSLSSSSDSLTALLLLNAVVQVTLFIVVACIPFLRTGRMSYVDIAWPFGVALIGAQLLVLADGSVERKIAVGAVYLFIGLRMGLGAVFVARTTKVISEVEFPRYRYRRMILEQSGTKHIKLHILAEIMLQGFANISVLALPGFIIASNASAVISYWEIAGLVIWLIAYMLETTADAQKMRFISKNHKGVCNIGLWRYSRHPNYFSEWLVWTALVVAAMPSWLLLKSTEPSFVWLVIGAGILGASIMLYVTLTYLTGAKPAEYYSMKKRAGYKAYQEKTSMFFPWFLKK